MEPLFFDTSVLLCAYDSSDAERQRMARWTIDEALQTGRFVISAQVMHEFYKLALSTALLNAAQALGALQHLAQQPVVGHDAEAVLRAARLQQRHGLSVGDALAVQAALDAGCRVLYSDALPAGLCFDAPGLGPALWVVNPMQTSRGLTVQEPVARYAVHATGAALAA